MTEQTISESDRRARPFAFRDQACLASKSGSTVTIECDNPDYANDLFDWLFKLSGEGFGHD